MSTMAIITLVLGLVSMLAGVGGSIATNVTNKQSVEDTNATNLEIAEKTNAANAEQAELAYRRSLPQAQLQDMLAAGMSKPAALQKLAGGGSYQMPTLQSAHMEAPQSNFDMSAIGERLANIPANVEQSRLQEQELQDLKDIAEERKEKLRMFTEEHNLRMINEQNEELRRQYGHDAVKYADQLRARINELAAQKGVDLDTLDSEQKIVSVLGLSDEPLWRNAPTLARDSVLQNVRATAAENRANREQANRDADRKDRHTKVLDDLKNSEFARSLSHKQQEKLTAEIESIWQDVDVKNDAKGAVMAENEAREIVAKLQRIASELNLHITEDDLRTYMEHKNDPDYVVRAEVKRFWRFASDVLPVNAIAEALRLVFK